MTKAELKRLETEKKHAFIARAYATVLSCIPEQTVMLRNSVQIRLTHQSYNRYIRFHKYDKEMYLDVVGHDEHGARRYERMVEIVHTLSWRTHNEWAVDESLLRTIRTKYIIYPLMLIGNGSIVMTAETIFPLSEKHIGWVYAERTAALHQVGKTSFSASSHKAIRQLIGQAVSAHNQHLHGQCYGYELYRYGRCIDSDCEICGDLLWAIQQIESRLPAACKGMTRRLESG